MTAGAALAPVLLVSALLGAAVLAWPRRVSARDRLADLLQPLPGRPDLSAGRPSQVGRLALGSGVRTREPNGAAVGPPGLEPDLVLELVACGLRSGLSVVDALAAAAGPDPPAYLAGVVGRLRLGAETHQAWGRPPASYAGLARALILAELSGAPAAGVVSRVAADLRAHRRERAELAAARLGVRLVLPLGLAVLPGFVLLAVVPIVLGLAESVLRAG